MNYADLNLELGSRPKNPLLPVIYKNSCVRLINVCECVCVTEHEGGWVI